SGIEILPSGRTGSWRESDSVFHTEICSRSSGPITKSGATLAGLAVAVLGLTTVAAGAACWAATNVADPRTVSNDTATTNDLGAITRSPPGPPLADCRVLLQAHVLDLVEEGAVADLEHLRGLHAIPAALLQR